MSFKIEKRNKKLVDFDGTKIIQAVLAAMSEVNEMNYEFAVDLAERIEKEQTETTVFAIESRIIKELYKADFAKTAEAYSEYRARREILRLKVKPTRSFLSDDFLNTYKHALDPFPNELGKFVYYRTYSRPIPDENRRERWWETVARVIEYNFDLQMRAMQKQGITITPKEKEILRKEAEETYDLMYNLKLFPSGRTLWVKYCPLY